MSILQLNLDQAVQYHYNKFPPEDIDYKKIVGQLANAAGALARFDQMLKNMHNSNILSVPLRNQEAVISSRIEGTVSTMDEILRLEADYDDTEPVGANARTETIETFLYQRTLKNVQRVIEEGQPITEHLIRTAHQQLLSWGRGATKSPGQYKIEQNYLTDHTKRNILFVPIRPEMLQDGLDKLFKYIKESSDPVLLKTAIAHIEFEALHPFKDGNGRIGRMLITLMLWKAGTISAPHYYISGYFEENKDRYIDLMRGVSEKGDWTSWCLFFLEAVEQQAIRNLQIAENINTLYGEMKQKFSNLLASRWSVAALDFIFTNPVYKNNKFTNQSGIPKPTAGRFTRILLENGLIVPIEEGSGRRSAIYMFEPLMQLVRV
ncbi:MAG TPA: Fic family protein [Nitrosospira sp.]|nr:Fic family protein [Nitrosospira sp.]